MQELQKKLNAELSTKPLAEQRSMLENLIKESELSYQKSQAAIQLAKSDQEKTPLLQTALSNMKYAVYLAEQLQIVSEKQVNDLIAKKQSKS